jgi:regulator of sigma E protease
MARRNGVVVEEFGIGFPPRAWSRKLKSGLLFSLNWLPLGGFVKLQGEHDNDNKKGDYGAATFWQKTKILFAGVVMNWVVAALLLTILAITGLPKILPNQFSVPADTRITTGAVTIVDTQAGYPAVKAGLKAGDEIIKLNNRSIKTDEQLITATKAHRGETVAIEYKRDGQTHTTNVTLRNTDSALLGVGLGQSEAIHATWSAPIVGIGTTAQFSWLTLQGVGQALGNLFTGLFLQFSPNQATHNQGQQALANARQSVAGPVGILGTIFPAAAKAGLTQLTFLTAIISLTLAVMNVLPIPALDGGRWFVTAIYRLRHRTLTEEVEEKIQLVGFTILMLLVLVITVGDVARLF